MNCEALKLLVVDDDDVDRERIRRMLDLTGLETEIQEVSNVSDSLTVLEDDSFDCIIVDYRLGSEDGLELLTQIRTSLELKSAVIMITGLGDEAVAAEALRLGASDYLTKSQLKAPLLLSAVLDAIHRNDAENRLRDLAHYDDLTGLVSRHLLIDRLQQEIANIGRTGKKAALAFLDLDDFKPVNDNYGHNAGDAVLVEIASRLKNAVRTGDTVARIGGDEFVLLLSEVASSSDCEDLLSRILLILNVPIRINHLDAIRVSSSIGVAIISEDKLDADTVLRRADHTMYQAKSSGRNKILFFDPEEEENQRKRRDMLAQAEKAVRNNEFLLHYQPKVNFKTKELVGVEALIRWQHPDEGLLFPGSFEEALQHSLIGIEIGDWVIEQAIQQQRLWHDSGVELEISVNISPSHLQSFDFVRKLDCILSDYTSSEFQPNIEFEVLESVSMRDIQVAVEVLKQCRQRGIKIALDDFGTGYASLKYLKQLPLDVLKIDQGFIKNIERSDDDIAIVKSVVALSEAFGYQLVAEGVETDRHLKRLMELGCYIAQGYYIAKPMADKKLVTWIDEWRRSS